MNPQITNIADHAVLVTFADTISDDAHAQVRALDRALAARAPEGTIEVVPALVNLLVTFDPLVTDHDRMATAVRARLAGLTLQTDAGTNRRVQVCYDADLAPDLDAVATAAGLSRDAVITAHLAGDYRVSMYGFAPGYAYLTGVVDPLRIPRKPAPLRDVPAGSVIIAGPQCLITTLTMPTGWSIIGRSPTRVLTADPTRPFLFDVGDSVTFHRIDRATYDRITAQAARV